MSESLTAGERQIVTQLVAALEFIAGQASWLAEAEAAAKRALLLTSPASLPWLEPAAVDYWREMLVRDRDAEPEEPAEEDAP